MSTYFTNFSEYSDGSAPSDWSFPWNANDTWTVEDNPKYLYCNDPDSVQCIKWDDIDSDAERQDCEILYLWESGNGNPVQGLVRGSGSGGSGWYAYTVGGTTSAFRVFKHVNSTTLTQIASVSATFSASTKYWIRFRVNGTSLKARYWADGSSEPSSWAIDTTDSDVTGDGFAGLRIGAANAQSFFIYQTGYGTAGDTAPASAGGTQALSAAVSAAGTSAGAISLSVPLAAAAAMQATASGAISLTLPLAGAATGTASAAGGVSLYIPLSASAIAAAVASGAISTQATRYARPDADIAAGTFTASGGGSLYAAIDEAVADDGDYISSSHPFTECEIGLSDVADPGVSVGHAVVCRAWAPSGSGWLSISLYQGATLIAARYITGTLPATPADYVLGLTTAQADSITDYTDLRVRLSGLIGELRISQIYLDVQRDPVALSGSAAATGSADGSLSLAVTLSGAALAQAAAAAGLDVSGAGQADLAGAVAGAGAASGALSLSVPLAGAALTASTADGSLTRIVPLAASSAAASMATGGLDISVSLSASALASALAQAGLDVTGGLQGAAQVTAQAEGALTLRVNLEAAAIAQAVAAGMLSAQGLILASHPDYRAAAPIRSYVAQAPARVYRIAA